MRLGQHRRAKVPLILETEVNRFCVLSLWCFLRTRHCLRTCPVRPIRAYTCSQFGYHPATVPYGCAGWAQKRHARFESSEALAEQPAVARTAAELHGCYMGAALGCRLQRRSSVNIFTAWPGRVAQAPRAGRARAPWSLHTMLAPVSRPSQFRDQLQLHSSRSEVGTYR